jgi:hypothetical protein
MGAEQIQFFFRHPTGRPRFFAFTLLPVNHEISSLNRSLPKASPLFVFARIPFSISPSMYCSNRARYCFLLLCLVKHHLVVPKPIRTFDGELDPLELELQELPSLIAHQCSHLLVTCIHLHLDI